MFIGPYGYVSPADSPVHGPPRPTLFSWHCVSCDVRWVATESGATCWSCGTADHVLEYGSAVAMWAAAWAHVATIA